MSRKVVGIVVLVGALGVVASACGGSPRTPSHPSHPTTTSPTTAATSTRPAPTTKPVSPSSTPTSAPATARCTSSELHVSVGTPGAGLGHEGAPIVFENSSSRPCTLQGYPGVGILDASGQQVSEAVRTPQGYLGGMQTGSTTPPLVTLAPGGFASAFVEGTDVPSGTEQSCPTYSSALVTPPTSTRSVKVALFVPGCSPVEVHPVLRGKSGATTPES